MRRMNAPALTVHSNTKPARQMRWWYESLADYMIANPMARQNEIAAYFGRTPTTISLIINTDAFKAYFRKRRQAHADALDAEVRGKLYRVANSGLDAIITSLDKKRDSIPMESLHRTVDTTLKSLGYGVSPPANSTNVTVAPTVNVAVSVEDLEAARKALRASQQTIDITPEPPPLGGSASVSLAVEPDALASPSPSKPKLEDLA